MAQAQDVYQLATRIRELARDSELPDYVAKLFQAADDLESRAAELEGAALAA